MADDVEAEIRASRQCRRGTRSHHRFGGGGGHNGFGSSSSSGGGVPRTVGAGLSTDQFFDSTVSADGYGGGNHHHYNHHSHNNSHGHGHHHHQHLRQFQHQQPHQHQQQRVPAEWTDIDNGNGNNGAGNGNGERSSSGPRGWDSGNSNTRGQGHKRERPELRGGGSDGGWGASLRGFRGGGGGGRDTDSQRSGNTNHGGDVDCGGSAFMGVSGTASQTSSPPPSIMSSDDVSVSSYGHPVTVLPGSPNNMRFDGRPPPRLAKIRLEAVRSPVVRRNGGGGGSGGGRSRGGRGGGGLLEHGGPVFTSPDASKHVQELCSPRSAFTPRSASSVSSLASSRGRR